MDSLQSIKTQLISQINALQLNQPHHISVCSAQAECTVDLLGWLKAQPHYPQFYFQLQHTTQCFATLGAIRTFQHLDAAQDFVNQHNFSLFGGIQFYGQTTFFLPQLVLEQRDNQIHVTVFIDQNDLIQSKDKALQVLKTFEKTTALLPLQTQADLIDQQANPTQWVNWVEKALAQIYEKAITKLVLANKSTFALNQPLNAKDFLAQSQIYNKGCYHFLFAQDDKTSFLGSSPERLYARHEHHLKTEALAGTAPMSEDHESSRKQADWLLADQKNIHENQLVADGICANLAPFTKHIEVGNLSIKQLRQVQHLRREITALLTDNCTDLNCLQAIHPTAAVAGLPQQKAKTLLQQIEHYDRSWYAGTLGFFNQQQAEFCVAIRSAFVEVDKIHVFAGAGIVEGSVPLLEWQEIERKAAGLISLLKITTSKNGEQKCQ